MMNHSSADSSEYRNLATNTFYSFLFNYGSLFFTLIYSFLLARLFTDILWGFLILATSYITIIVIITSILPPGLNFALNYYIPRYLALNDKAKIKSLIRNSIIIKIIFLIPVFIVSILGFTFLANLFALNLEEKVSLLYILAPLIFINSLNFILYAINRGFSKFNYDFIFLIIQNAIHILPLLIFFIFDIYIEIEIVAWIVLISSMIPFILNSLILTVKVWRIKPIGSEPDSFKKDFSKTFKYGSYVGFTDIIERLWKQTQIQGVGFFLSADLVTGYNIAQNYQKLSEYSIKSFHFPLLTSLTSLNTKENYKQASMIYRITYQITLFLLLILSGILFFGVEFILDFIFLEDRLIYSNFLRLIVLASIFKILGLYIQTYLNAQHKGKLSLILKITYMLYIIPLFFLGLIYFEVEGAIIYGLILGNIISLIIQIFATYKFGNIRLNIRKIIIQYITFFIPLGLTLFLENLLFKELSFNLLKSLGLSLFVNFDFLSMITFLLLFISMNFILKTVRSTDINNFESLLNENKFLDKIMIKFLNFVKKFTRK